jgi:hypothetical protein
MIELEDIYLIQFYHLFKTANMKNTYFYLLILINFNLFSQNFSEFSAQIPREKIYLIVNKPYYFAGDSIGLEAVMVDACTLQSDTLSIPLYVELIDARKNALVERWILKTFNGQVKSKFKIPSDLESNYFKIRAYTNWMRNFSSEAFPSIDILVLGQNYRQNIPTLLSQAAISSLSISVEGGTSVNGLVNNILIRTQDNFQNGLKSFVSLKSDSTTIRIFDTNDKGEALVEYEPESGKKYFLESGQIKTLIPPAIDEGVVMRGYFGNDGKKLSVTIQNNLKTKETIKMVLQTRGKVVHKSSIEPQNKVVFLHFLTDSLPEGILNVALFNLKGEVLQERTFIIAHQDKNDEQNYFLFNAELSSPIESSKHYYTEIGKINVEMISKKNILYGFEEFQKNENAKNKFLKYKNEFGISVNGRVGDSEDRKLKDLPSISLVIIPEEKDSLHKKQLFAILPDKNGNFSFENMDFYGQSGLNLQASIGKKNFKISLENDSIPRFNLKPKLIDWHFFLQTFQEQILQKDLSKVLKNIILEEKMKTKELDEVVVTAKKEPRSPLSLFSGNPSARFLPIKLMTTGAGSTFKDFFGHYVNFRLAKHLKPVVKFYLDDALISGDLLDDLPNNVIAYVDIHDGTSDSFLAGASILVNIYTKGYFINPMVSKIMDNGKDNLMLKVQRNGYYLYNAK